MKIYNWVAFLGYWFVTLALLCTLELTVNHMHPGILDVVIVGITLLVAGLLAYIAEKIW